MTETEAVSGRGTREDNNRGIPASGSTTKISARNFSFFYGEHCALRDVSLEIRRNQLFTIMGPSGSGKTTFLRALNRLGNLIPNTRHEGSLKIDGVDVYGKGVDVAELRRRVGMVFALPVALPMSIFSNVAHGPRMQGVRHPKELEEIVEKALRDAILWDEVKDRLSDNASRLSGGQLQRLSIARVLALEPEIILLDEPTSGLDPISTLRIEELLWELVERYTIVLVTHNPLQAARIDSKTAFFLMGELIETGSAYDIFTRPKDKRTEDYVSGKYG
ncbi:MAG: phosphate ABC transporter ATP-binding protein [Firmicutes bacterium]|nr:phosphate ABC transporter ATP-binding protein [Bacillota bacterium]